VLAIALLGFAAEGSRVENAPAKSTAPKLSRPAASTCGIPTAYAGAFRQAARRTELPLSLLAAVAWEESRMNPGALSEAGARGILQLMPGTAKAMAVAPADPRANIVAGAHYLQQLISRFGGDLELALAAYNAGPTAVEKLGRAPSLETLRYAKNVEARAASLAAC
jgi:soluble lytic murein transglycosylase-like protein